MAQEVEIRRVKWTKAVDALFGTIEGRHIAEWLAALKRLVRRGRAFVCGVFFEGEMVGAMILAAETIDGERVMVVKAGGGDLPGRDLTQTCLPAVEMLAHRAGCAAVRFETSRPGLVKKSRLLGYGFVEIVMQKRLENAA